jgi:hypothetical protein
MAHFAEIDQNNIVLRVIVIGNDDIGNLPFPQSESVGVAFCQSLYGSGTLWKQTSYNKNFRVHYAGIGFIYDSAKDAFIPPRPEGDGWVFDEATLTWVNPDLDQVENADLMGVTRV